MNPKKLDWWGGLKVAVIVGTILTLINQFDAVLGNSNFNWLALGLTYLVPFVVFNWGRLKNQ